MEIRKKVETFEVNYKCDKPGCEGYMEHDGMVLTSYPAKYPHVCTKCAYKLTFTGKKYPFIEHKVVG